METALLKYIKVQILGEDEDFDLTADDDLLGSGLLNSMSIFKLMGHIEAEYGVKIPPQDMTIENFMTVEATANYIQRHR